MSDDPRIEAMKRADVRDWHDDDVDYAALLRVADEADLERLTMEECRALLNVTRDAAALNRRSALTRGRAKLRRRLEREEQP